MMSRPDPATDSSATIDTYRTVPEGSGNATSQSRPETRSGWTGLDSRAENDQIGATRTPRDSIDVAEARPDRTSIDGHRENDQNPRATQAPREIIGMADPDPPGPRAICVYCEQPLTQAALDRQLHRSGLQSLAWYMRIWWTKSLWQKVFDQILGIAGLLVGVVGLVVSILQAGSDHRPECKDKSANTPQTSPDHLESGYAHKDQGSDPAGSRTRAIHRPSSQSKARWRFESGTQSETQPLLGGRTPHMSVGRPHEESGHRRLSSSPSIQVINSSNPEDIDAALEILRRPDGQSEHNSVSSSLSTDVINLPNPEDTNAAPESLRAESVAPSSDDSPLIQPVEVTPDMANDSNDAVNSWPGPETPTANDGLGALNTLGNSNNTVTIHDLSNGYSGGLSNLDDVKISFHGVS